MDWIIVSRSWTRTSNGLNIALQMVQNRPENPDWLTLHVFCNSSERLKRAWSCRILVFSYSRPVPNMTLLRLTAVVVIQITGLACYILIRVSVCKLVPTSRNPLALPLWCASGEPFRFRESVRNRRSLMWLYKWSFLGFPVEEIQLEVEVKCEAVSSEWMHWF